jgi:hypothetical protein
LINWNDKPADKIVLSVEGHFAGNKSCCLKWVIPCKIPSFLSARERYSVFLPHGKRRVRPQMWGLGELKNQRILVCSIRTTSSFFLLR